MVSSRMAFALADRVLAHVRAGPPEAPEDSEGTTPAVEVRVLWGGDLLRVVHLDPPRSFHVGEDGCDLAVDAERLGARRVPVVLVGPGGVSVIAPLGASGSIVTATGEHGSVERAVVEGLGEPVGGAVPGTRIPLAKGARVSLTLPSRAAGTAYRGAPGSELVAPTAAPLVLEMALVNASRAVGRSLSMRGSGRLLASTLLVATAMTAWLFSPALMLPPEAFDVASESDPELLRAAVAAAEDRWGSRIQEDDPDAPPPGTTIGLLSYGRHTDWRELCGTERDSPGASDLLGLSCAGDRGPGLVGVGEGSGAGSRDLRRCRRTVDTGSIVGDVSEGYLGFGSGEILLGGSGRSKPVVHLGLPQVSGRLPPEVVSRVVRRSFQAFKACYECGLRNNPNVQGRVTIRFVIGADGAVSHVGNGGTDLPDLGVLRCIWPAFEGMSFPRPESGTVTVTYPIFLAPA